MVDTIKILDPVKGLVDYVNDIKPYHSKVIESLVEYVGNEAVDVRVGEEYNLDVGLGFQLNIEVVGCEHNGFGALAFGDPSNTLVLSPNPAISMDAFPAINSNNFIVLGDQREIFQSGNSLTFRINSYIEERFLAVSTSTGSPPSGGTFTVLGDQTDKYIKDVIFTVRGSYFNDTSYIVSSNSSWISAQNITIIPVDGQVVVSNDISGMITIKDSDNNGIFSVITPIFTEGKIPVSPYTTVFVSGITLVQPNNLHDNERYVSSITATGLIYKKILPYSNALKFYNVGSPPSLTHTPDEGIAYAPIVALSQSSPASFTVEGEFAGSNLVVGDEFFVVGSTDNNTSYIINSITHIPADALSSPQLPVRTQFGVSSIHDSNVDGFVKLDIPSNVFIVDNDFTNFFKQGTRMSAITGSMTGEYTVLNSSFINNETRIRVLEDLFSGRGTLIAETTLNTFIVNGNHTVSYKLGMLINVDNSVRNNGSYSITAVSFDAIQNKTSITVLEEVDDTDDTGEIHTFARGELRYQNTGFGQTPTMCDVIPETLIAVNIKDTLVIDNYDIRTSDDIFVSGIETDDIGYELPAVTIFSSVEPTIDISVTAPVAPIENALWFDISQNTGSPSAPGTLKQYMQVLGGSPPTAIGSPPTLTWVEVPNNKAYWVDDTTNYMYYRTIYQYYDNVGSPSTYITPIDTTWILEYTKIPGFNEHLPASGTREVQGSQSFIAFGSTTSEPDTIFELSADGSPPLQIPLTTGSPAIPNPAMLEVTINSVITSVVILSQTSFQIITPELRVGDYIVATVYDDTALPSNTFIGAFDANAAISETFDMLLGYKFHIDGIDSVTNTIHIPDTSTGDVYNIFMQGSPPVLIDNSIEIVGSTGSPNNDGVYTITNVAQEGSPINHVVLTVAEPLLDAGIFAGSPLIEGGKALYQQWFQYIIVNTTTNTIVVSGDAINDILVSGSPTIKITYSANNNGNYTVQSTSFDGRNTTITVAETITDTGNSGGWVESI